MNRRALLSVYRKDGIVELARGLAERGFEIVSTGGTAADLGKAKVPVVPVARVTGFPEILDGRVKTLHPVIHAGILARRDRPEHVKALAQHDIAPVDVVVVNLYPFEDKVAKGSPFEKVQDLRYGENPHQRAAFYSDLGSTLYSVAAARKVQGKELSFNNILDLDAAWRLVTELPDAACVIVKHTNPCGTAVGSGTREAYERAWACDPTSAFGGILAFNRRLEGPAAEKIASVFVEAVIAPGLEPAAKKALAKKPNLRVMDMDTTSIHKVSGFDLRRVMGGLLAQQWDLHRLERDKCEVMTKRKPTDEEWKAMLLAWTVVKHVKSNAIVYANAVQTVGVGAGQMSRVDAARIAAQKAQLPLKGTVAASDAFFPFRDGLDEIARAGAAAVIQPGGSIKDDEVIAAADEHGLAMVFTGVRHFRH